MRFFYVRLRHRKWIVLVSMTLFIRCVFTCVRFTGVCGVAHDWVPYPFCAIATAILWIVATGISKGMGFQLHIVVFFTYCKCRLLLSKRSKNTAKMPVRRINRHVHQRNNVQQRQWHFFVLFMAWQLQMICRMMWIHPLNELRFEKGEFYTLYPDLRHFGPKFFNMYRMSVPKFDKLLRKISPYIEKNGPTCENLCQQSTKLVITLR